MKKLFLSMLAAVTLFASCSEEELVSQTCKESMVSFTVTTPELGSRAVGDGKTATDLYFVVYDETIGEQVTTISSKDEKYAGFTGSQANVSLPLLNGHKYSLIFWATNANGAYSINWDTKSIALTDASALVSNKEDYDAFYAYEAPFTVTGEKSKEIKLKRPFAQLNIGTTTEDLEGVATYYGVDEFTKSTIVVSTPTAMDLTTGNVSGEKELTYAAAEFISSEKLKNDYEYLSMNYLLVSNEKSLVNVAFSISEGTKTISKTFENIPVQRNYKTNIYGSLFTSTADWTVEVAPDFDAPEYNPAEQLAALFEQGGEMTLYTDVALTEPLVLTEGKTVTLNMNGNTIQGGLFAESNGTISAGNSDSYPIWVQGGTLNIKGEGTIKAEAATYSMAVFATAGEVNIYGGEYYNAGEGSDLIYAKGTAKINIYGGYFKACEKQAGTDGTAEKYSVLNLHDGSKATASITVYGGSFYQFDPANNKSENPAVSFVAEGYTSTLVGENYVVVEGTAVADTESFENALETAGVVSLVADVTTSKTANLLSGSTLDGGNNDLTIGEELANYYTESTLRLVNTTGDAEIKNITIDGNNASYAYNGKEYGIRGIFLNGEGTTTIDNVIVKNVTYTLNDDSKAKTIKVSNSTLQGWTSYNPGTTGYFENVSFEKGTYATLRPHGDAFLTNCTFEKDFVLDLSKLADGKKVTIKNCYYNGVLITSTNIDDLAEDNEAGDIVFE